jgi:hypothetical protein
MSEQVTTDVPDGPQPDDPAPAAPAAPRVSRRRLALVDAVIALATVLTVVGMFAVWANRLLLNPDNWASTSTQLLSNPQIRSATANYLVDQLYANVDVAAVLRQHLPTQLQPLAGPAAGALQNVAVQGAELALSRPRIQNLWSTANRAADQAFVTIVNGGRGPVGVNQGAVTLDLGAITDQIASRLGLPSNISSKLPASIAHLTVLHSNQLQSVQDLGQAVKNLALWLTILSPLAYALAIFLAGAHRRRTLMSVGFAVILAGLVGIAGRQVIEHVVVSGLVQDASQRPAVDAAIGIGTQMLATIAGALILIGAVLAAAAWFAGPAGPAVAGRRALAPYLRDRPGASFGVAAAIMLLVFIWDPIPATGTPVGIIFFLALALFGTEVLRRQTRVEFPDAQSGQLKAATRARIESFRSHRQPQQPAPAAATSEPERITDMLERLTVLHDAHSLSDEEFESAKKRLLDSSLPRAGVTP